MESRPEVAASGTWAKEIDADGRLIGLRRVPVGARMEYDFWRPSPLLHPTAIIRASQLGDTRYDREAVHAEDYDLWLRLGRKYKLDNLPEDLLLYRVHGESVTQKDVHGQLSWACKFFCRRTGLDIPYETYLELIGFTSHFNPVRRARLRWQLARAISQPYRRFLGEDLEYARNWLRPRLSLGALRSRGRRAASYLLRRVRGRAGDADGGGARPAR
jgi:hypothetical protein